jgi:hypothetical protein
MPNTVRHGQFVDATLTLFLSDHSEHSAKLRLWVDRSEMKRNAERLKHIPRGTGLYGPSPGRTAAFLPQRKENGTRRGGCGKVSI